VRGCLPFGSSTCARSTVYNSLFRCPMGSHGVAVSGLPACPDPDPAQRCPARRAAWPALCLPALRALCRVRRAPGCHPGRAVLGSPLARWNLNQTPGMIRGGVVRYLPPGERAKKGRPAHAQKQTRPHPQKNRHPPENIFFKFRLFTLDKAE
jgi:hypothetical protein